MIAKRDSRDEVLARFIKIIFIFLRAINSNEELLFIISQSPDVIGSPNQVYLFNDLLRFYVNAIEHKSVAALLAVNSN